MEADTLCSGDSAVMESDTLGSGDSAVMEADTLIEQARYIPALHGHNIQGFPVDSLDRSVSKRARQIMQGRFTVGQQQAEQQAARNSGQPAAEDGLAVAEATRRLVIQALKNRDDQAQREAAQRRDQAQIEAAQRRDQAAQRRLQVAQQEQQRAAAAQRLSQQLLQARAPQQHIHPRAHQQQLWQPWGQAQTWQEVDWRAHWRGGEQQPETWQ